MQKQWESQRQAPPSGSRNRNGTPLLLHKLNYCAVQDLQRWRTTKAGDEFSNTSCTATFFTTALGLGQSSQMQDSGISKNPD